MYLLKHTKKWHNLLKNTIMFEKWHFLTGVLINIPILM